MSLLGRAVKEARTAGVGPFVPGYLQWSDLTSAARSATPVNHDTAMACSAVWSAVSFISETIASLPVGVYQKYPNGTRYGRPTPQWISQPIVGELDWCGFIQQVMTSLLLDGNAFIGVERAADGLTPVSLWPLDPKHVQVRRNPQTKALEYMVVPGEGGFKWASREILHLRAMTMPGAIRGMSPIDKAAAIISNSLAAQQFSGAAFRNGAVPGTVVIAPPGRLTAEMADDMAKRFDAAHAGTSQAFKTVVLGSGADVKSVSLTPEQVQMIETLKWGVVEIARWYRIPPHIIGDVERTTSWGTGVAEQNQLMATHTLGPWIVRLERGLQRLVYDTFLDASYYIKLELKGLMRANPVDQADYFTKKIAAMAMIPDEWRAFDDDNPLGQGGDKVLHSVQWQETPPGAPPPAQPTPSSPLPGNPLP